MNDPSSTHGWSPAPPPPAALSAVASASPSAATGPSSNAKRKELQQEGTGPLKKTQTKKTGEQNDSGSISESVTVTAAAASAFEDLLDDNSRLKILSYLTWQDLVVAAQASRRFRDGCRHPSLTQNADRQMVLTVRRGRCDDLYRRLADMADAGRLATYPKLKVVFKVATGGGGRVEFPSRDNARQIRGGRATPHVASLELSVEPADGTAPAPFRFLVNEYAERELEASVADFLPNLRQRCRAPLQHAPGSRLRHVV
jgi:hypothetical protein